MATPVRLAVSHGTADPAGQQRILALVDRVRAEAVARSLTDDVRLAHVDVQHPVVDQVLTAIPAGRPAVIADALVIAARPSVAQAVAAVRGSGRTESDAGQAVASRVVASYLLAPGHFQRKLFDTGADVVTAPLLGVDADEEVPAPLVQLVLDRFETARTTRLVPTETDGRVRR